MKNFYKYYISGSMGDVGHSIILILRSIQGKEKVLLSDIKENNLTLQTNEFFIKSISNEENYYDWLERIIFENSIDFFIPTSENELALLAKNLPKSKFFSETSIIWPGRNCLELFDNKYSISKYLESNIDGSPKTWSSDQVLDTVIFPLIAKPIKGSGSRNIKIIKNIYELYEIIDKSKDLFFQEYVGSDDQEYTCTIFKIDKIVRILILRRTLMDGKSVFAKVTNDEQIYEVCLKISKIFDFKNSINVQLRKEGSRVAIFEINFRFSSSILMRHIIGFSDLSWSLKLEDVKDQQEITKMEGVEIIRNPNDIGKIEVKF